MKALVKWALPLLVIFVGIGGMLTIQATADQGGDKEPVDTRPTVEVESMQAQDYQVLITGYGEVQPLESTMLAAQVSGEVVSWNPNFVPGGLVRRGDVLFSIEKDSYEAALIQAEANLSSAKALLIEEQARAEVAKREAKNMPAAKISDLYLRKPQVLSAKAAVKSAQARLKIARRDLKNCEVVAPYDALVISRNVGVGQYVNQGAGVAELNSIEAAEIIIPIAGFDNAFLPGNVRGQTATIVSRGFDGFTRKGSVSRDLGVVDQATRMSQLVIRENDPYSLNSDEPPMKFGTYVEVSFVGKTLSNIYRLPQDLVNNRIVWVVSDDDKLEARPVDIVREEGEYLLISKGLKNKDRVVITVPEYPTVGMEVKVVKQSSQSAEQNLTANGLN